MDSMSDRTDNLVHCLKPLECLNKPFANLCCHADSTHVLAVVSGIDCHRGLEETRQQNSGCVLLFGTCLVYHFGLSVVLVCLGKVS